MDHPRRKQGIRERSKEDEKEEGIPSLMSRRVPTAHCSHRVPRCHRYPVIRIAGVPSGVWVWLAVGDDKVAGSVSVSWCC